MLGIVEVVLLAVAQSHPIPKTDQSEYEGTISVVELDGKEKADRDGRIVFGVFPKVTSTFGDLSQVVRGTGVFAVTTEVVHGHFRFREVVDSMFIVLRLELGGDVAHVRGNHPYAPTPTSPWQIEADRDFVRSVSVVGVEDESPLEHVVAAPADESFPRGPPVYDDLRRLVLDDATSPIELAALDADPSRERETSFWIRAPHREWRRWKVRFEKDASNFVRLEPAASLVVELDREIADAGACVKLFDAKQFDGAGDRWIDRILARSALAFDERPCSRTTRVEFDPLHPGDYAAIVLVEYRAIPFFRVTGYGIARVTVPAKSATKASIAVTGPVQPAGIEFSGTLRFDPAWEEELPTLDLWTLPGYDDDENGRPRSHVVRAADYRPIDGVPNSYRWTFGPVPPGRFCFRVDGWSQFNDVIIGRKDVAHRDLNIGPPVETLVQVVDDRTGEPAQLDELHFGVGDHTGICPRAATPAARRGEFLLRSPAGPIELKTWQRDYWGFEDSLVIVEDMPKVVLHARRVGGVHLHLTVDGKPLRPDGFSARLVGVGDTKGGSPKPSFSSAEGNVLFVVEEVGRYRLDVTAGIGMTAVPPREFELRPGYFEDLNLELSPNK